MSSEFIIEGLTHRQRFFADILWSLTTTEEVNAFIASLPQADRQECELVKELLVLAFMDDILDTQEADRAIDKIKNL